MQVLNGRAHPFGNVGGEIQAAIEEEDAEFVAAQSRQNVARPKIIAEQYGDLTQQLVAGGVAACVVDQLELVEIQIHQGVLPGSMVQILDGLLQAALEVAAICKPRQFVVRCLP